MTEPYAHILIGANEALLDPLDLPVVQSAVEAAYKLGCGQSQDSLPPLEHPPIDRFFGLSYTEYLVVPRTVLQSMPAAWQRRLLDLFDELEATIDWKPHGNYYVLMKNFRGKVMKDPLQDYELGQRRLALRVRRDPPEVPVTAPSKDED